MYRPYIVSVAMSRKNVHSNVVENIFLESSYIPETKNQCFHQKRKTFWSANLDFKMDPLKYLVLTISLKQSIYPVLECDMPTIVWVR